MEFSNTLEHIWTGTLKKALDWNEEEKDTYLSDRFGTSILMYAVTSDNLKAVREILRQCKNKTELLSRRVRDRGFRTLGIRGGMCALHLAMTFASPDIVTELLSHGAECTDTNTHGQDALMCACEFGRYVLVFLLLFLPSAICLTHFETDSTT